MHSNREYGSIGYMTTFSFFRKGGGFCPQGADKDLQNNLGVSALIAAAGQGHVEVVRVLLDAGASSSVGPWDTFCICPLWVKEHHV